MGVSQPGSELHPLADIDQVIHVSARLMVLTYLYVVENADYVFLMRRTGLTWGNLSTHMTRLEESGYIKMLKEFKDFEKGGVWEVIKKEDMEPNRKLIGCKWVFKLKRDGRY